MRKPMPYIFDEWQPNFWLLIPGVLGVAIFTGELIDVDRVKGTLLAICYLMTLFSFGYAKKVLR